MSVHVVSFLCCRADTFHPFIASHDLGALTCSTTIVEVIFVFSDVLVFVSPKVTEMVVLVLAVGCERVTFMLTHAAFFLLFFLFLFWDPGGKVCLPVSFQGCFAPRVGAGCQSHLHPRALELRQCLSLPLCSLCLEGNRYPLHSTVN